MTLSRNYDWEACERIFAEPDRARDRPLGERPGRRRLVLGVTVEFGTTLLVGRVAPFLLAHREIPLDFFFSHHLVQPLLEEQIDLAVDCTPHPSVDSVDLLREHYSAIASPAFLADHPVASPDALADLPVLSMDSEGEWWINFLRDLPAKERPGLGHIVTPNHVRGIINGALAGLGVGLVPTYTVLRELADGRLVELFPGLDLLEDRFRIVRKQSRAGRTSDPSAHGLPVDPGTRGARGRHRAAGVGFCLSGACRTHALGSRDPLQ